MQPLDDATRAGRAGPSGSRRGRWPSSSRLGEPAARRSTSRTEASGETATSTAASTCPSTASRSGSTRLPATGPLVVHCASGYRSSIAASLLEPRRLDGRDGCSSAGSPPGRPRDWRSPAPADGAAAGCRARPGRRGSGCSPRRCGGARRARERRVGRGQDRRLGSPAARRARRAAGRDPGGRATRRRVPERQPERLGQRELARAGYEAWNLAGGLQAWDTAGLPLEPDGGYVA